MCLPKPVTTVGRGEAEDTAGSEAKHCGNSALGARYDWKSQHTMNFSRPEKTELGATHGLKVPGRS